MSSIKLFDAPGLISCPDTIGSATASTHLAAMQLLRGVAIASSQSSTVRLGQTIQYATPSPGCLNPSLDAARRTKSLFNRQTYPGPQQVGIHTRIAQCNPSIQVRHKLQLWFAVYPLLDANAKSKEPQIFQVCEEFTAIRNSPIIVCT